MSIFLLQTSTLTINRVAEGYWDSTGAWIDGATSTFDIECNIQPFQDGRSRTLLPEGINTDGALIVYSKTRLNPADQLTDTQGDTFTFDSFNYRIIKLELWSQFGLLADHYKHIAVRQNQNTNGGL